MTVSGDNASISGATINLGAGDDKITLATVGQDGLKGATINGGAGRDTLIVSGDLSGSGDFTLKNIEVLQANTSAKVSYAQIKDQALTLTKSGAGTLEIVATNKETTIDLTKLNKNVATGETALTELTLDKVGSGANSGVTVTLNKDDGISETIKLASDAKNANAVTITGIASGDKLDASGAGVGSSVSGSAESLTSQASIQSNKLYFIAAEKAILTGSDAVSALSSSVSVTQFSNSTVKAAIAFNYQDKAYIFAANASTNSSLDPTKLTLVGIVDNIIDASDSAAAGVITFA